MAFKRFIVAGLYSDTYTDEFVEIKRYKRRKFAEEKVIEISVQRADEFISFCVIELNDWEEKIRADIYRNGDFVYYTLF